MCMPTMSRKVKGITERFSETKLAKERTHLERVTLELDQLKNSLVPKDELIRYVTTCNTLVKSRLMSLPDKVAPRCLDKSLSEIAHVIREQIREILEELSYEGSQSVPEPDANAYINARIKLVLDELDAPADTDS